MPGKQEMIRWQEEQNERLSQRKKPETFGVWRTRKNREHAELIRRQREEAKRTDAEERQRVNKTVLAYFRPEIDGEVREWTDKMGTHRFSRWSLKKMLGELDIAGDSNIFDGHPTDWILEATDEELLAVLSQKLPAKPYYYDIPVKDGLYAATIMFRRMRKE